MTKNVANKTRRSKETSENVVFSEVLAIRSVRPRGVACDSVTVEPAITSELSEVVDGVKSGVKTEIDADLAAVIDAWPLLSDDVKRTILDSLQCTDRTGTTP